MACARSRSSRWLGSAFACALLVASLGACVQPAAETRLVLVVDTDMPELNQAEFTVTSPADVMQRALGALRPGDPAYLVMERGAGASAGPYRVLVRGLADGRERISRRATLSFVNGKTLSAALHLARACVEKKCEGGQVCALGACRAEELGPDELTPWTGEPPTLSGKGRDAGTPRDESDHHATDRDASVRDASTTPDGSIPETCAEGAARCSGDRLILCESGRVTGTMPCPSLGACTRGTCKEGVGCSVIDADEGASCGNDVTCSMGVCGGGSACTGNCSPACDPGVAACELDCSDASNCDPSCPSGVTCDVLCDGASNCNATCAGTCEITCGDVSNCNVSCQAGSDCDIDCTGDANCKDIDCAAGASCILRCGDSSGSGSGGNCELDACPGGAQSCANNVYVCQAPCP